MKGQPGLLFCSCLNHSRRDCPHARKEAGEESTKVAKVKGMDYKGSSPEKGVNNPRVSEVVEGEEKKSPKEENKPLAGDSGGTVGNPSVNGLMGEAAALLKSLQGSPQGDCLEVHGARGGRQRGRVWFVGVCSNPPLETCNMPTGRSNYARTRSLAPSCRKPRWSP